MKIKIRRREFDMTSKDRIMDNGVMLILITRKVHSGYFETNPTFPKKLFHELLKSGKVRKSKDKYKDLFGGVYDLYEFVEE